MDLVDIPVNPVPSGAVSGMIDTSDGRRVRFARWRPTARKSLGTVCVFTGRAEFIEKYYEIISDLRRRGFHVVAMDWRGQGGSDRLLANPTLGHVESFDHYERDVEALMTQVTLPDSPPPYFALAHSMGGAVMLSLATRAGCWFDRIVLSAPMIRIHGHHGLMTAAAEVLNFVGLSGIRVPGGGRKATVLGPFAGNPLTSDPVRYERMTAVIEAAPQLGIGAPSVGWFHAACRVAARLNDSSFPYKIRTPILIVAAGSDRVVSTPAIERFALHMRNGRHLLIPGARHELLMERDNMRELFWAAFDSFVPGQPVF
ncbi:MAG: alpha/beta hydrolase [Rhodobiaceae bacterium]|nr:alpha/beta hydrolase [Rhodobiaceae bacterium]MCC0057201.1 alpha/beta hydrolase [Rhodobiaceae bacterium]